jgi:hypothetical protein
MTAHLILDRSLRLTTLDPVRQMPARKSNIIQFYRAKPTILSTSGLLARMVVRTVKAFTWLSVFENLMHALRMASSLTSVPAVVEFSLTRKLVASLWTDSFETVDKL